MESKSFEFGHSRLENQDVEQAMETLATELRTNIEKLQRLRATPSGRGQIDALLGQQSTSNDPSYKAAYSRVQVFKQLAEPEELQMIEEMQRFAQELLKG